MAITLHRFAATVSDAVPVVPDCGQQAEPVLVPESLAARDRAHPDLEFFDHLVQRIHSTGLLLAATATEVSATAAATIDQALVELDQALHHIQREVLDIRCSGRDVAWQLMRGVEHPDGPA